MNKETIFDDYGELVYKFLLSYTKNPQISEDLTQDTFYIAIKEIDKFSLDKDTKFSTWLCQIAKNLAKQEFSKIKKNNDFFEDINESYPSSEFENQLIEKEKKLLFYTKVHNLKDRDREILFLRLLGDLSYKEIGKIFDKTETWARVTYYRAKNKIVEECIEDEL